MTRITVTEAVRLVRTRNLAILAGVVSALVVGFPNRRGAQLIPHFNPRYYFPLGVLGGAAVAKLGGRELSTRAGVGYGAPAKGNTLLNYCGIDTRLLPYTVDKSPLKTGRYTPGMHLPVRETSALLEDQPDYVMILAWNFADEVLKQQAPYREKGGKFIVPIPEPRVV